LKEKLKDFTAFTRQLFPHELAYLRGVARFEDKDNRLIFKRICENKEGKHPFQPYDLSIDKRKYSRLKKWIQKKLSDIDVDLEYDWITRMERQIMQDDIDPKEEKAILRSLQPPYRPTYYFIKLYELARHFRQYLLIRMRRDAYEKVQTFLEVQAQAYHRSLSVYEEIHKATVDITNQYSLNNTESQQWEESLRQFFYDEELDGMNRYLAAVRLNFIYLNYREYDKLRHILEGQDRLFCQGICYSRRILANYYSNRLLLHSLLGQLDPAIHYGYLSIQSKNSDYLHYVNNLCSVLLRKGMKEEALHLMRQALPEVKQSPNTHARVAFATFYIRCLNQNKLLSEGQRYGELFLRGYKDQVFSQHWHSFFTAYLQNLLAQQRYDLMVKVSNKYKLLRREEVYKQRPGYIPTLNWYIYMASYKEGMVSSQRLMQELVDSGKKAHMSFEKSRLLLRDLIEELRPHLPDTLELIQERVYS